MSKDKNFKIVRNKLPSPKKLTVGDIKVGDVFEREGGLHMRVHINVLIAKRPAELIEILNINTGAVWYVHSQDLIVDVSNVVIDYNVTLQS
jgi:hypothetical protein